MNDKEIIGKISNSFPFLVLNKNASPLYCQFLFELTDYHQTRNGQFSVDYCIFRLRVFDPAYAIPRLIHAEIFDTGETGMIIIPTNLNVTIKIDDQTPDDPAMSQVDYANAVDDLAIEAYSALTDEQKDECNQHMQELMDSAIDASYHPLYQTVREFLAENWTYDQQIDNWHFENLNETQHPITNEEYRFMMQNNIGHPARQPKYLS